MDLWRQIPFLYGFFCERESFCQQCWAHSCISFRRPTVFQINSYICKIMQIICKWAEGWGSCMLSHKHKINVVRRWVRGGANGTWWSGVGGLQHLHPQRKVVNFSEFRHYFLQIKFKLRDHFIFILSRCTADLLLGFKHIAHTFRNTACTSYDWLRSADLVKIADYCQIWGKRTVWIWKMILMS